MYRLKPGLSLSVRATSDSCDSAIDNKYAARSSKPRTSPGTWLTGLYATMPTYNALFSLRDIW